MSDYNLVTEHYTYLSVYHCPEFDYTHRVPLNLLPKEITGGWRGWGLRWAGHRESEAVFHVEKRQWHLSAPAVVWVFFTECTVIVEGRVMS